MMPILSVNTVTSEITISDEHRKVKFTPDFILDLFAGPPGRIIEILNRDPDGSVNVRIPFPLITQSSRST